MNCSASGCKRPVHARGMCQLHYRRWWKHGDPLALDRPKTYAGQECAVDGCAERPYIQGWCSKHYQRWKANGDPLATQRRERGSGSITVQGYRIVSAAGHPLANARGTFEHRIVLYDKIGPGVHACHWCQKPVRWDFLPPAHGALAVDHLDHDKLNNDPANLVPSCWQCNIGRTRARTGLH